MNRQQIAYCILLTFLLVVANTQSVFGQGKLARVRDAVRESKPAQPENSTRNEHRNRDEERQSSDRRRNNNRTNRSQRQPKRRSPKQRRRSRDCGSGFGLSIGHVISPVPAVRQVHVVHHTPTPVAAPPVLIEPQPIYQPVVNPVDNPIVETPVVVAPVADADYLSVESSNDPWGVRMSAIGGTDFDDITFGRFDLLLQMPGGPGIDTSVTMLRESGMDFRDHLYLGDVNFVFEPLSHEKARLRIGIGVNWLGDSYGGDAGFNMTSGFDLQLTNRTLATAEIDLGTIGDTDITHAQISLGRIISPATEWTVGYDYIDIGGTTIGSAFTGLRFRF